MATAAILLGAFAVTSWAHAPVARDSAAAIAVPAAAGSQVEEGRELFKTGCSSCHGFAGEGIKGTAPSLEGVGEAASDFYLRTGRMPLSRIGDEPVRGEPRYDNAEIEALNAFVGSLGPGPSIPNVDVSKGSVSRGMELFTESCAGCHAISAKGGVVIGAYAPPLGEATGTEVGEAIRIGPYLMPRWSEATISPQDVNSIAAYVARTQEPEDAGGLGIGHIGPVPEGMIAWFAAILALLLVARLIGERLGGSRADDEAEEPR